MDGLGRKMGLAKDKKVIRKAEELRRLSNLHFNSSTFGVVCLSKQCIKFSAIFMTWNAIYWEYSSLSPFLTHFHPQGEVCKSVLYFELAATK